MSLLKISIDESIVPNGPETTDLFVKLCKPRVKSPSK